MKFLLDENVHRGLSVFLIKEKHDVKLCPKGIKNGEVIQLALEGGRTLISRDSDFLKHSIFPNHFGIIILRMKPEDLEMQKRILSRFLSKYPDIEGKTVIIFSEDKVEFVL